MEETTKIRKELIDLINYKLGNTEAGVNSIDNDFLREERKGFCNGLHEAIGIINNYFTNYAKKEV